MHEVDHYSNYLIKLNTLKSEMKDDKRIPDSVRENVFEELDTIRDVLALYGKTKKL